MKALDFYPLITTARIAEARDFYVRHFGATVLFEASWVVVLSLAGEVGGFTLGFMTPDHPTRPPGPEPFDGKGMILTVQAGDAAAACDTLRSAGAPIVYGLSTEPWGQRRFMTRDPAGVLIDVVEQIEPAEGYWERYAVSQA